MAEPTSELITTGPVFLLRQANEATYRPGQPVTAGEPVSAVVAIGESKRSINPRLTEAGLKKLMAKQDAIISVPTEVGPAYFTISTLPVSTPSGYSNHNILVERMTTAPTELDKDRILNLEKLGLIPDQSVLFSSIPATSIAPGPAIITGR